MYRLDRFFECTVPRFCGFQYEENFLCIDNLSLPTVYGLNPWDDIRTGSQLRIHHSLANPYRFFLIYCRNQDNKDLL